jgi:hypothetical protein
MLEAGVRNRPRRPSLGKELVRSADRHPTAHDVAAGISDDSDHS